MKISASCEEERESAESGANICEMRGKSERVGWGNMFYAGKVRYRVRVVTIGNLLDEGEKELAKY